MEKVIAIVSSAKSLGSSKDDDIVDRLHSKYTVMILVVFTVVVSANIYAGDPIYCWVPAEFEKSHEKYANSFCWVKNTYYLPFEEYIPKEHEKKTVVPYYQWVPFILLVQALFFYAPSLVWRALNEKAGVDADNILESAQTFQCLEKSDMKEKTLRLISKQIHRFVKGRKQFSKTLTLDCKQLLSATVCRCCGRRQGNYLIILYFIIKLLFLANSIGQIFFLNLILGNNYNMYGITFIRALLNESDWLATGTYFPRVTMCDFHVRRLGNVQRYTVQCVLPINMYNEKIYLFLWFWMVFLVVVTILNILLWSARIISPRSRLNYFWSHLDLTEAPGRSRNKESVRPFVQDYMRPDGAFLLRLIEINTNKISASEIVRCVWDIWKAEDRKERTARQIEEETEITP